MKYPLPLLAVSAVVVLLTGPAAAQMDSQSISLLPGWNAVFLEVTPANDDPDVVFEGLEVESVWQFVPRTRVTRFIDDPTELIPDSPDWLTYFPPSSVSRAARDLHALNGGTCYLVKMGGGSPETLTITGTPAILDKEWGDDAYNLVGFTVSSTTPPTFAQFFSSSPAHVGQTISRLNNATGRFEVVPASSAMRRGEAFWILTNGESAFQGPFDFQTTGGRTLDFATDLTTIKATLTNRKTVATTMTLSLAPSAAPLPGSGFPLVAGEVPLSRWDATSGPNPEFAFVPFTSLDLSVPANGLLEVELAVRRADMTPFTIPDGETASYQSLLNVTSTDGTLRVIPVTSSGPATEGGSTKNARAVAKNGETATPLDNRRGLWVGTAAVSKVSEAGAITDKITPTNTLTEFQFPIIVHVDGAGTAKLLQQVYLMYKPPVLGAPSGNPPLATILTPGRYVLVTDDSLLSQFQGVRVVENSNIGRRMSTAAFSFSTPQQMTRVGAAYACDVVLGYDDPMNPFKHKYNNFHDNLDGAFQNTLPEGVESYTVTRTVEFDFSNGVPDDFSGAGFGDTTAAGVYRETITGLHRETIYVEGTFRMSNVSSVEVLNDGI